ncbi:molybdopterin-guanine dinucleotide biosynthesis protein A [Paenibacillus rhizosphaerae]|uniref:Probable molybdenum cofactor guanylyltransferase n=1 Tax=Paenibacillus rhizosphaerae TaxID=297318 RepID=A0A839TVS6_9BACL|nr:molybdenum cofactor guanylyltransferase [Paenibacillus rhizosphaerae]MBB3130812.1 molybdopterin-guanine dinucleotide biosynthesis protein A [Paenibacillus rhizosphaerae]
MLNMTGILLAGGRSSRMGTDKALLSVNGETVIGRVIRMMSPAASRIIISANDDEKYAFLDKEVVHDRYPGQGPLSGLDAGLHAAATPWSVVAACDMPFVTEEVFRFLARKAEETAAVTNDEGGFQAIVPVSGGRIQPLLAAYHRGVLPSLEQCLSSGRLRLTEWLDLLKVCYVSEEELIQELGPGAVKAFYNMNEPLDYKQAMTGLS